MQTANSTRSTLLEVLEAQAGIPAEDVDPAATFDGMGIDSLTLVEIALTLQDRLAVPVYDEDLTTAMTFAAAVEMLDAKSALVPDAV